MFLTFVHFCQKINEPFAASFSFIFVLLKQCWPNKTCTLQWDSISDCRSTRQARWPLDHVHSKLSKKCFSELFLLSKRRRFRRRRCSQKNDQTADDDHRWAHFYNGHCKWYRSYIQITCRLPSKRRRIFVLLHT